MKFYKLTLLGALCALLTTTVMASELFGPEENWVLSLGGQGATTTTGDSQTAFGATIDLGHTGHLVLPIQAGVRQGVAYDSTDEATFLDTKVYLDFTVVKLFSDKLDVFLGGNIGITYGNTPLYWSGGPEGGVRWWIKKDIAILGRVEYPFDINNSRAEDVLRYFIGFQVKL